MEGGRASGSRQGNGGGRAGYPGICRGGWGRWNRGRCRYCCGFGKAIDAFLNFGKSNETDKGDKTMTQIITTTVSSKDKEVKISLELPTAIIGERINPTGRKKLQKELKEGIFDTVKKDAIAQVEAGAAILDVNAGVPGADEPALLLKLVEIVSEITNVPLCIDTANPRALEGALKFYKGKALVNSVTGEASKLETVLPLIKQYGAAVIG